MPKVLLFDLDNTIWDFRRSSQISLQRVYERYVEPQGIAFAEWQARYLYHNDLLWQAYQRGEHTARDVKEKRFGLSLCSLGLDSSPASVSEIADFYLTEIVNNTVLYAGVRQTLEVLSYRYTLGIISNGLAVSRHRLSSHGIGSYFDTIVTAADAGVPKPAREIFNLACRRAGVLAEEAAYVGDDYHSDVVGAKSAGLTSIWYNPASELPPVSGTLPDYEIDSFEQLIDIFITR